MGGPPNSFLQELVLQQAQISQQIEAQEAQLGQVRLQIAFFTRVAAGGSNEDSSAAAAAAAATAAMLMRLRSGGGSGGTSAAGPPPSNRMMLMNHQIGSFGGPRGGGGGSGNSGMLLNSPSPSADLAPRLADLKFSSMGKSGRIFNDTNLRCCKAVIIKSDVLLVQKIEDLLYQ